MAIPIKDYLIHLAMIDCLELAEPYRTIASQEFDGLANRKWRQAAEEVGVEWTSRDLRDIYMKAVLDGCQKEADRYWERQKHG